MSFREAQFIVLLCSFAGCPPKDPPPAKAQTEEVPATPIVDQAFLQRAFGGGVTLANKPLIVDLDPRPGLEALIATQNAGKDYQVAVVRGNGRVLSRAPLGGKILAHANIRLVGDFRAMNLLPDGSKLYLMPVETLVYKSPVCGLLVFRYREDAIALVGEFASTCWRKAAGGDERDPFEHMKVLPGAEVRVEMDEPEGKRVYRWDAAQASFLSLAKLPGR
jgi:hypothetical protein